MTITNLYLAANHIAGTPWGHLQIVGKDGNGSFFELEVQAGVTWDIYGNGQRIHDDTTNMPFAWNLVSSYGCHRPPAPPLRDMSGCRLARGTLAGNTRNAN